MRTIQNILAVAFATMTVAVSMAQFGDPVYVNGYYRWDGTYVRPHYRTRPDGNFWNNWSSYGNINPYTGDCSVDSAGNSTRQLTGIRSRVGDWRFHDHAERYRYLHAHLSRRDDLRHYR
jgi:hypothetical protein